MLFNSEIRMFICKGSDVVGVAHLWPKSTLHGEGK
jgi:hypothetical protein